MSPIAHGLLAWMLAVLFLQELNDRRLVTIIGVASDIDGIHYGTDWNLYYAVHHTFGHSYVFGSAICCLAYLLATKRIKTFFVGLGAFSLHLFADVIGSNWEIYPFFPLSNYSVELTNYLSDYMIYDVINPVSIVLIVIAVLDQQ